MEQGESEVAKFSLRDTQSWAGQGPEQPALTGHGLSRRIDQIVSRGPFQPTLSCDSVINKLLLSDTKQATPRISLATKYNSFLHIPALKQLPDEPMANFISYVCQHNKLTKQSVTMAYSGSRSTTRRLGFILP